jgi:sucrose phosphorylase
MKNQVQLITYVDRLSGGGLKELHGLLRGPLAGLFGGVHLLPFFFPIDGSDAGFDPIDHTQVDLRLGGWDEVKALGDEFDLVADLIVNHVSSKSPQFEDYSKRGTDSPYAGLFLTYDRVFPNGAKEADLLAIYRPRPGFPCTTYTLANGEKHMLWTTFTPQQLDIDVYHTQGQAYLTAILDRFQHAGVKLIRLDAVGYAIKKAGTSCFMIPETFDFIAELTQQARKLGIDVLVEIHSYYLDQIEIAKRVDRVYDFALPPLVLHSLFSGDATALARWLSISPRNAITVLDTHDGIGVIDVGRSSTGEAGLLDPKSIDSLVETIHERSGGQSRQATGAAASNLDLYQVNCTYYDALGRRDNEYLIARAVQFFAPGVPQVYYTGLLAGENDMDLLTKSRVGRDINRHYYTQEEIVAEAKRPVVQSLAWLIRLRNQHPAFQGELTVSCPAPSELTLQWQLEGDRVRLEVDFAGPKARVVWSAGESTHNEAIDLHLAELG